MKTLIIFFFLAILSTGSFSRDNFNIGVFAGTSYYQGDINTSRHFYAPAPAFGMMVKYDFNDHYSLKAGLNYGQISANDLDFAGITNQTRGATFVNNFYDFSLLGEFNFQPFRVTIFKKPVTTFITAGMAHTTGISESFTGNLNIPFGGGVKYGISSKVTIGFEWIMKKTFTDNLDGVKSFGQFNSPSLVHNNDWVSLAG
ncbi:MAG: DUF6089 family protein, partial [Bacteroidales bacterium]